MNDWKHARNIFTLGYTVTTVAISVTFILGFQRQFMFWQDFRGVKICVFTL